MNGDQSVKIFVRESRDLDAVSVPPFFTYGVMADLIRELASAIENGQAKMAEIAGEAQCTIKIKAEVDSKNVKLVMRVYAP